MEGRGVGTRVSGANGGVGDARGCENAKMSHFLGVGSAAAGSQTAPPHPLLLLLLHLVKLNKKATKHSLEHSKALI